MFVDCLAFLVLGLGRETGAEDDFQILPCASTALFNSFADGLSVIDSSSSSLLQNNSAVPDLPNEAKENGCTKLTTTKVNMAATNAIRAVPSPNTEISTDYKNIAEIEQRVARLPSALGMMPGNLLSEESTAPFDEGESSKTLNTRSTLITRSSLDTKTLMLTPSLDTKTYDMALKGLSLVDTMAFGDTTEAEAGRNHSNPSPTRPRRLFHIDRVPSFVTVDWDDDQSLGSSISMEDHIFTDKNSVTSAERNKKCTPNKLPFTKQLLKGKGKIPKLLPWRRSGTSKKTNQCEVSMWRPPSKPVPNKRSVIEPTKSNDVTATTVETREDECDHRYVENVPFDEPHIRSSRLLAIEESHRTAAVTFMTNPLQTD